MQTEDIITLKSINSQFFPVRKVRILLLSHYPLYFHSDIDMELKIVLHANIAKIVIILNIFY